MNSFFICSFYGQKDEWGWYSKDMRSRGTEEFFKRSMEKEKEVIWKWFGYESDSVGFNVFVFLFSTAWFIICILQFLGCMFCRTLRGVCGRTTNTTQI